jgi:C4-dicarboxylate-specific signal transduction histidine kinase
MAEVATGVLHNVGNVLNSLGVSASLVQSKLRSSRVGNLKRMADLLTSQGDQAGRFLEHDERGREMPGYLAQLGENLVSEHEQLRAEAAAISAHVGHIRNIVAAQQTYARRGGVTEAVDIPELLDGAIAIHFANITDVTVRRDYDTVAPLTLDRHKLIQILGNLLSNARHALKAFEGRRALTVRVQSGQPGELVVEVEDSGVGIGADVLPRLFEFGFTTKKDGHGFGLHTSAILAKELGGELVAHSDGHDRGARFTLRLLSSAIAADARTVAGIAR